MNTKQVIVLRKFKGLRTGKYCSQAAHASMAFLTKRGFMYEDRNVSFICDFPRSRKEEIDHWLLNSFRKICVYVNSEQELEEIHKKALDSGLISNIIEDNGATEFDGVKTKTAVAIGPHWDEKFDGLTNHLPLL